MDTSFLFDWSSTISTISIVGVSLIMIINFLFMFWELYIIACSLLQLDRKTEDLNKLRIELEEKRAECLKVRTQLQEMDDKFFDSQTKTKEELGRALRV